MCFTGMRIILLLQGLLPNDTAQFRAADVAPMAANVAWLLYECPLSSAAKGDSSSEFKVELDFRW